MFLSTLPQSMLQILLLATLLATTRASCDETDRESLLSFSLDVSSESPLNWSTSTDCCTWEGVGCDENQRVSRLWLPSRGLVGSIAPAISNLSFLSELNLSYNSLSGALPDRLFTSLDRLEIIDLSFNRLQGQLPGSEKLPGSILTVNISSNRLSGEIQASFLQESFNLVIFNVSNNSFSGMIPSSICSFSPNITSLDFSFNDFVGQIPKGFGGCSNLESLRAAHNNLSGLIPDDIYQVSTLRDVSLASNFLSGSIDESIGNLTNLKILALGDNQLVGKIPDNIGKLHNLEGLFLHRNQLNGSIPFSLGNCSKLTILFLRGNNLEGELSSFNFSTFVRLTTIDLGTNFFTGTLPTSLFLCKSLSQVRLSGNRLQGEVSSDIPKLQSLTFLSLSNNSFTNFRVAIKSLMGFKSLRTLLLSLNFFNESLPGEESLIESDAFQNLQFLALSGAGFTGEVPMWLSKLPRLEAVDICNNQLTGSIPGWIAKFPGLFYLDLSGNRLSGNFPLELTSLPRISSNQGIKQVNISQLDLPIFVQPRNTPLLQYKRSTSLPIALYLHTNNLSGQIPEEIGKLKSIQILELNNNNFSGNIPDAISKITALEKLDLSENHLSGEIPESFKNLNFLSSFSVADNNLEGPIPTGGQFDTFSSASYEGNPGLCGQILQKTCLQLSGGSHDHPASKDEGFAMDQKRFFLAFLVTFIISFGVSFLLSVKRYGKLSTKCANAIISRLGCGYQP